jgi:hypothetical protein
VTLKTVILYTSTPVLLHALVPAGLTFMDGAAEDAGVQVLAGALDLEEEVADAAQAVRDARLVLAQPVVVGDAHVVHLKAGCVGEPAADIFRKSKSIFSLGLSFTF